jgi:hypothetical protein
VKTCPFFLWYINMMKSISCILLLLILVLTPGLAGCGANSTGDFAIYLTRDDIRPSEMASLTHYTLAEKPVISIDDIISYTKDTHEMALTADAFERVTTMRVLTSGKSFVVCVGKKQLYWGAFWTGLSSQSFSGVTIWVYPSFHQGNTIELKLGYPSPGFYEGKDPRPDPEIFQSLEKAGKLK